MKRAAILQSNYIPWKGYFDMIAAVDEFILYDHVQYTRQDWRNRNRIKTPLGAQWLTVPVHIEGLYHQTLRDTRIAGTAWAEKHWKALKQNYGRAAHFEEVAALVEPLYGENRQVLLSRLNRAFIEAVCAFLGIGTRISNSCDYALAPGKTERLADLCAQVGADEYVSGPAARDYIEERCFSDRGIRLTWFDYGGYPEYPQLWGEFIHEVSILDMLFNCGKDAPRYMKHVRP